VEVEIRNEKTQWRSMRRGRSEFKDTWGRELQDYGGRTKGKMLKMEVVDDDEGVLFLFFFF